MDPHSDIYEQMSRDGALLSLEAFTEAVDTWIDQQTPTARTVQLFSLLDRYNSGMVTVGDVQALFREMGEDWPPHIVAELVESISEEAGATSFTYQEFKEDLLRGMKKD